MALFNRQFGVRRMAGALVVAALFAGVSTVAIAPAQAQVGPNHHFRGPGFGRGHGFVGPGRFHGRFAPGYGWYGAWPYYPYPYPAYNYVRYYYPQYYYPRYAMPRAVYVLPPPPPMAPAQGRDFTVYFDFDQYNLTGDGRRVVDAAIAAARAGGPARIDVTGNTDLAGTNRYNIVLSRRRAETVRHYMIARGVDAGEIAIRAEGKTNPAVRTADGVREPRNRRVEIVIIPLSGSAPPATSMARPPMVPAAATMTPPPSTVQPVGQPTNLVNP